MLYLKFLNLKKVVFIISLIVSWQSLDSIYAQKIVQGTVYHDLENNSKKEINDPGISNVLVSNGRDIVITDENGKYQIPIEDNSFIFVIEPSGWKSQISQNNIPRYYKILTSQGSSGTLFQGIDPIDEFPNTIDFALYPREESDKFRVIVFADTQCRTKEDIDNLAHDTIQEIIGSKAAFGVTLGDLVHDDLDLFQPLNEVIGQIGIPWRHVIGNHDLDFTAKSNWDARGAYYRTYGPSWYAFTWGKVHFIALDNTRIIFDDEGKNFRLPYRTGLWNDQIEFIKNFLSHIPDDELVVYLVHQPWTQDVTPMVDEYELNEIFEVLSSHPHSLTLAGHLHRHHHEFITSDQGWPNEQPHHMVNVGSVFGNGWTGLPDEYGIPHAMMRDGTPRGYGFLDINGNEWNFKYKASRRPDDFQMHIYSPNEVSIISAVDVEVFANVFNALPGAEVEMRIGIDGSWQKMESTEQLDPLYKAMQERENKFESEVSWRRSGNANPNPRHLWKATLPKSLEVGTYTIFVRSSDNWAEYKGRRIIRITD